MSRRHADLVDVVRRDDVPEQFLWRERLYQVREVLAHWVEAGRWWSSVTTKALVTGDGLSRGGGTAAALASSPSWARGDGAGIVPPPVPEDMLGTASLDDGEREFWRVEAHAGRSSPAGVFDLCFDWSAGRWQLVRVVD
jgi:hypothetical protein